MSDNTTLTAEQIIAMEPGREMDAAVARSLGYEVDRNFAVIHERGRSGLRQYSKDIAAAWEIVEKMQGIREFNGKKVRLQVTVSAIRGTYTALISDYLNDRVIAEQMGSTAPEAICRAALLARLEGLNP